MFSHQRPGKDSHPSHTRKNAPESNALYKPILQMQKLLGNRATIQMMNSGTHNKVIAQRYPYIDSDPPSRRDAVIYGIYKMNAGTVGDCVYVGQVVDERIGDRFYEHVTNSTESTQPWHLKQGCDYSSANENNWPYVPRTIADLGNVTRFEATAAEQLHYELKGGASLSNRQIPMRKDTFNKYKSIIGNYDHTNINATAGWKPDN